MKSLAILGSTGSIGVSTLEVVRSQPQRFRVAVLTARRQALRLAAQIREFRPELAVIDDPAGYQELCAALGASTAPWRGSGVARWEDTELRCGADGATAAVREGRVDLVVAAVVGMAGLDGVLAALESGKDVALANKESLVVAGALVLESARRSGARILPVDSEHSAIFQLLQGGVQPDLESIVLTASGGPFRTTPLDQLGQITPQQAVQHPRWSMGAKISVDSATMMNKALEVIEAHWLFQLDPGRIEVIVHPQSIVHSMVRLVDGTVMAQLSDPDMKGPIAYALNFPAARLPRVMRTLDFATVRELTFEPLDPERFPAVGWAKAALMAGAGAPAALNAANEVAVDAFLAGTIPFLAIGRIAAQSLERFGQGGYTGLGELRGLCLEVQRWARQQVQSGGV
jgi:1-deoxy-D-xylulose-5-phosphate reductoisomerase